MLHRVIKKIKVWRLRGGGAFLETLYTVGDVFLHLKTWTTLVNVQLDINKCPAILDESKKTDRV